MLRLQISLIVMALFFLTGCGKSPPPKAQVRGTVTVDKKLLKDGQIYFVTVGKAPEILEIKDGTFEGKVEVGEQRRVEIAAYKDAPSVPMEGVPSEPSKMNYLPEKYNSYTTLSANVTIQGPNEFKFDLTSR